MRALRVLLAVGGLVLAGCAGGGGTASTVTTASEPYAGLWSGLCQARARAGDPAGVREAFFNGAHQPLHELAAETAEVDRAAAAHLHVAKQAFERDLTADPTRLGTDLDALLAATRGALAAIHLQPPRPCQEAP